MAKAPREVMQLLPIKTPAEMKTQAGVKFGAVCKIKGTLRGQVPPL